MQSPAAVAQHMPRNPKTSPETLTAIQFKSQFQKHIRYNQVQLRSSFLFKQFKCKNY